ncbi:MAG TPA: hypothetical protein VH439_16885 [Gemmatimonadales bacterium]|jgi:hypothetical protein
MRPALLASTLAVAAVSPIVAQSPHNGAYLGGGFEAAGAGADYERAWGFALQAGFVRQYRRAGLRLGSTYFERNRQFNFSQQRAVGLSLEVTYDVATSRFRPYLIGGWGLYREWGRAPVSFGPQRVDVVSPTMIAGFGFRYRLKGVELFGELRGHGMTSHSYWASPFAPVTFGLKFD